MQILFYSTLQILINIMWVEEGLHLIVLIFIFDICSY